MKATLQVNSNVSSKDDSSNAPAATESNPPPKATSGDPWRFLLIELINQLGLFFTHAHQAKGVQATAVLFDQVVRLLDIIDKMPGHDGCLIIRRIIQPIPDAGAKPDYFILFGNQAFRGGDLVGPRQARGFKGPPHLSSALDQTFACFNDLGISALFLQLPGKSPEKIDQLRLSLNIVARFRQAVENNASITFRYLRGTRTIPLGRDSNGKPDPNLTLVAGLNGLSAVNMRELVKQADAFCTLTSPDAAPCRTSDSYNQIFNARSLRSQLIRPLVEINNLPWMQSQDPSMCKPAADEAAQPGVISLDEAISPDGLAGELHRYLGECLEGKDRGARELLNALFECDFASLDAEGAAKTMNAITRLLRALEKAAKECGPVDRLLFYLHDQLGRVSEAVLSQLSVQRQGLKIENQGKTLLVGMIHPRLIDIINLVKERITVEHKISAVRAHALDLKVPNAQFWTSHFRLSDRAAARLQRMLARGVAAGQTLDPIFFSNQLDELEPEAGRVFEIMWCLLRQNTAALERSALLDGLVLLGERLKSDNDALGFLLSDLFQRVDPVEPGDRNGFALATMMLRTHRKERYADLERTPEDVLAIKKSLHPRLVQYAAWRMDIDPFRVLSKFKTIRNMLGRGMRESAGQTAVTDPVFRPLLALEREGLIFTSLAGGKTARLVLRGALDCYGDPGADIYLGHPHVSYLIDLMGHLRIVLRGMARLGQSRDLDTLKAMEQSASRLMALDTDPTYARRAKQMLQWVAPAIRAIQVQTQE